MTLAMVPPPPPAPLPPPIHVGGVTYQPRLLPCGRSNCRTCAAGKRHGPYWYAIWKEAGKTKTKYIGRKLPPAIVEAARLAAAVRGRE